MTVRVAIVGTGNIGTDLLAKVHRNPVLELVGVAGIDPDSDGIRRARDLGYHATSDGLDGLLREFGDIAAVFDATSARAHRAHGEALVAAGVRSIDLTPAALGPAVVPSVNLGDHADAVDVSLITCGGQATIPIVAAVARETPVEYAEIVATIASLSAGPGTRQNIDEFTRATARGIERVGGAARGKAIIVLNPAEPPILMRNTVYVRAPGLDAGKVSESIAAMVADVQCYVPGYRLRSAPLIDGDQVTVLIEVEGAGDHLPPYAGNLDIMTSAAIRVAEGMDVPTSNDTAEVAR